MKIAVTVVALAFVVLANAQTATRLKDQAAARQLTDQVMAKVVTGDVEAGMRLAKPYTIIPDAEFETMVGQAKLQAPMIAQRFGKSVGAELIKEERAGESVIRIIHINKFERHLTRWTFFFYKTPTGWCLDSMTFDDKIDALFSHGG